MDLRPLGDQAVMLYCESEEAATLLAAGVRKRGWPWLIDVVQAYKSVAVFYDALNLSYPEAADAIAAVERNVAPRQEGRAVEVPCCYELGLDLERVARHTGLTREEIIALHSGTTYTVYAIGFCPGFPYLGYLPDRLSGVPRLETPRLKLDAGSVGLTGRQTGIYTEERPGGWNIIGRTPLELVNVTDGYFPLRTGDRVQFERVGVGEYERLKGNRLPV
jgi:KipI family sensor histidine kinase inhibitor